MGASIIVDAHDFTARNLTKAGYIASPLEDDSLAEYAVHALDMTDMTVEAVKEFGLSRKDAVRANNMFVLGMLSWMFGRPTESTITFLEAMPGMLLRSSMRSRCWTRLSNIVG